MTPQIFPVEIWSDEVTGIEALDIKALLERSQAGLTWSCENELDYANVERLLEQTRMLGAFNLKDSSSLRLRAAVKKSLGNREIWQCSAARMRRKALLFGTLG